MTITLNGTTGITTPDVTSDGLTVDSTTLVVDEANNRVGIGTSSPADTLDVAGGITISAADGLDVTGSDSTTSQIPLRFYRGGTGDKTGTACRIRTVGDGSNNAVQMIFDTADTERLRIDSSGNLLVGDTSNLSNSGIHLKYTGSTNRPISVHGYGGVDGTYVDWLISAPYSGNSAEQNRIRSSISSNAASSGLQFMISDGGGASTQTQSFRINRTSCTVIGSLSKGSGSFKIDHPLPEKTDTHHLVHSFIEGPQADLIYRGRATLVNGQAQVNIDTASGMTDGTFVLLCRDVQCFTSNETDWTAVRGSVSGNVLTIEAQDPACTATISWMVVGERQDKHMYDTEWTDDSGKVIVEPLKEDI